MSTEKTLEDVLAPAFAQAEQRASLDEYGWISTLASAVLNGLLQSGLVPTEQQLIEAVVHLLKVVFKKVNFPGPDHIIEGFIENLAVESIRRGYREMFG